MIAERQVIKEKVQKERFIWLSPLPCSPALGKQAIAAAGLSWCLLFSTPLCFQSLPLSLGAASRWGRHWSASRGSFRICKSTGDFVVTFYLSRERSEGEPDLAHVLLGCQIVGGRWKHCMHIWEVNNAEITSQTLTEEKIFTVCVEWADAARVTKASVTYLLTLPWTHRLVWVPGGWDPFVSATNFADSTKICR